MGSRVRNDHRARRQCRAPRHAVHSLFCGSGIELFDFRCGARHEHAGAEEVAAADELVFVRAGAFEIEANGKRAWVDSTRVLLLRRGEPYCVAHPAGAGDACTVLSLGAELSREALRGTERARGDTTRAAPLSGAAYALQSRISKSADRLETADALAVEEALLELVRSASAALAREPLSGRVPVRSDTLRRHGEIVHEVRCLLARRACEPLRLADIADALRWSPFHLARLFRDTCGLPLHRYRNRLRLRLALERIAAGEPDLTRIALEHGFSSHSHLDTAFRREFGFSPSALRRPLDRRRLREMSKILKVDDAIGRHLVPPT